MAQDAFSNGDRIVAESYYQFAEHYQRVLNENFEDVKPNDNNSRFPKNNGINTKPSRTERAISATNDRNNRNNNNENSADNQSEQTKAKVTKKDGKKEVLQVMVSKL